MHICTHKKGARSLARGAHTGCMRALTRRKNYSSGTVFDHLHLRVGAHLSQRSGSFGTPPWPRGDGPRGGAVASAWSRGYGLGGVQWPRDDDTTSWWSAVVSRRRPRGGACSASRGACGHGVWRRMRAIGKEYTAERVLALAGKGWGHGPFRSPSRAARASKVYTREPVGDRCLNNLLSIESGARVHHVPVAKSSVCVHDVRDASPETCSGP